MNCGGKIYKGETVTISVPFDVSGYTDLTITYSTTGDSKIVKTQDEVEIEGGFITYTFTGDELDLLPDGVIYYTIEYEVDGVDYVASTNTNLYLKTPAGYSGKTAEDYYQEGYEEGLENCSGSTPCNLEEGSVTVTGRIGTYYPTSGYDGFGSVVVDASEYGEQMTAAGYEAGYNQGLEDCPSCDCESAVTEAFQSGFTEGFDEGFLSGASSTDCSEAAAEAYEIGFSSGYSAGLEDCPECDCTSAVTEAYNSGRQSGYTDGYAQGEEDGHDAGYSEGFDAGFESGQTNCDCTSAVTEAYQSGYTAGLADCSGSTCNLQSGTLVLDENFSGFDTVYPDSGYNGFESVEIQDGGYGPAKYDEGLNDGFNSGYQSAVTDTFPIAYQSGYTDGFASGQSSCDCSSAYTEGFNYGFQSGITSQSAYTEGLGSIGSIEFIFSGLVRQSVYGINEQHPVISARMYSGDTFVGRYFFNNWYSCENMALVDNYDSIAVIGSFSGQGLPDPVYLTIRQIGIDIPNSFLNNWGEWGSGWTLTVKFNAQQRDSEDNSNSIIGCLGSGGFKMKPIYVSAVVNGYTPNTTHVIAELDY